MFYSVKLTQVRRWQIVNTKTGAYGDAFDKRGCARSRAPRTGASDDRTTGRLRGGRCLIKSIPLVALRHRHNHRKYPACGSQRSPE